MVSITSWIISKIPPLYLPMVSFKACEIAMGVSPYSPIVWDDWSLLLYLLTPLSIPKGTPADQLSILDSAPNIAHPRFTCRVSESGSSARPVLFGSDSTVIGGKFDWSDLPFGCGRVASHWNGGKGWCGGSILVSRGPHQEWRISTEVQGPENVAINTREIPQGS